MITINTKNLMMKILNAAIEKKASDIHIYPNITGYSFIKLRVMGNLSKYEKYSNSENRFETKKNADKSTFFLSIICKKKDILSV